MKVVMISAIRTVRLYPYGTQGHCGPGRVVFETY